MNVDYFIAKFEEIPDELWGTGAYQSGTRRCVLGHCGYRLSQDSPGPRTLLISTPEGAALNEHFCYHGLTTTGVNDGLDPRYRQPTPRARILAALRDIKSNENP